MQAQSATPESVSAEREAQRVQMSRAELELYVREGRPTGLLLRSVAQLKGMSTESVAQASGIPAALVDSIFQDQGGASIKKGAIKRVASVLGIDLSYMRFASGQVHVINLDRVQGRLGSAAARQVVRAVGLLARGAFVAELKVGSGFRSALWRGRLHVAQSDAFRAVFIGSMTKRFDVGLLPSAVWARETRSNSIVAVESAELAESLIRRDLTEGEFDELFHGAKALTWDDIRVASRVNGVSKSELMAFIASRASEADANEDDEAKRRAIESRPFLRLVDDQRAVANA